MMGGHYTIYFAALCCLLAGASIAPPPEIYMSTLGKGQVGNFLSHSLPVLAPLFPLWSGQQLVSGSTACPAACLAARLPRCLSKNGPCQWCLSPNAISWSSAFVCGEDCLIHLCTFLKPQVEICTSLADKLPCDQAGGSWAHICKASVSVSCTPDPPCALPQTSFCCPPTLLSRSFPARPFDVSSGAGTTVSQAVEVSRKMPEHVYGFIHSVSTSDEAQGDVAVHGAEWMVGTSLGLGLMVMGRLLYTPCLFCLPAVLVGYAAIQPLVPSLSTQMGVGEGYIYLGGACAGLVLALLQRHVFVWLLGVLIGVMSFITLLIGTTLLSELPSQVRTTSPFTFFFSLSLAFPASSLHAPHCI